ncbi:hypothetical protein B7R54_14555 [Subtercola boreus]|uniref:HTH tetR-type domain-containing protein n=1 Tax=Subtercola boreus TaxID=120213 RepID=A0A3E0VK02_9MICO|nr:TetR/AcrR family transcriptional regulator [Subtercola boreus]RFA10294.1 hypothetical protein B7R54_14555 [Subtercola boreus]TQL52521.1 TetR family transcriptional regulator [Subtercola boreus]
MARSSRADADRHKTEVLKAAVEFIAEHDPGSLTIPKAMAAAGLTSGGFYNHFASKDDFLSQVVDLAFDTQKVAVDAVSSSHFHELRPTLAAMAARYLSTPDNRDPRLGISVLVLSSETSTETPESATRRAYARGLNGLVDHLTALKDPDASHREKRRLVLATLSALAGASAISRALPDKELASELLEATQSLIAGRPAA